MGKKELPGRSMGPGDESLMLYQLGFEAGGKNPNTPVSDGERADLGKPHVSPMADCDQRTALGHGRKDGAEYGRRHDSRTSKSLPSSDSGSYWIVTHIYGDDDFGAPWTYAYQYLNEQGLGFTLSPNSRGRKVRFRGLNAISSFVRGKTLSAEDKEYLFQSVYQEAGVQLGLPVSEPLTPAQRQKTLRYRKSTFRTEMRRKLQPFLEICAQIDRFGIEKGVDRITQQHGAILVKTYFEDLAMILTNGEFFATKDAMRRLNLAFASLQRINPQEAERVRKEIKTSRTYVLTKNIGLVGESQELLLVGTLDNSSKKEPRHKIGKQNGLVKKFSESITDEYYQMLNVYLRERRKVPLRGFVSDHQLPTETLTMGALENDKAIALTAEGLAWIQQNPGLFQSILTGEVEGDTYGQIFVVQDGNVFRPGGIVLEPSGNQTDQVIIKIRYPLVLFNTTRYISGIDSLRYYQFARQALSETGFQAVEPLFATEEMLVARKVNGISFLDLLKEEDFHLRLGVGSQLLYEAMDFLTKQARQILFDKLTQEIGAVEGKDPVKMYGERFFFVFSENEQEWSTIELDMAQKTAEGNEDTEERLKSFRQWIVKPDDVLNAMISLRAKKGNIDRDDLIDILKARATLIDPVLRQWSVSLKDKFSKQTIDPGQFPQTRLRVLSTD